MMFRKFWWAWSLASVFTAQPSAAQWHAERVMCGPVSASVVKGDKVTVYATDYAVPDAHGGAGYKYLQIDLTNVDSGPTSYSIQDYGLDHIIEYTAQKNGAATATGTLYKYENFSEQPDEQNSCTISIGRNVSPTKVFIKDWLWWQGRFFTFLAAGFQTAAFRCAQAGSAAPEWCAYNWGAFAITASCAAITTATLEHVDPPDSDYMTIPTIQSAAIFTPVVPGGGMTWVAAQATNDMMSNQAIMTQVMRAAITAENRASTAAAAGDAYWAQQQQNALDGFLRLLSYTAKRQLATQQALANVMASEGIGFSFTAQEVLDTQLDEWFDAHLLASTRQGLASAGFSTAEIENMWMMYDYESPYIVEGSYPQRILDWNASMQSHVDSMVATLPEPNGNIALVVCGMLVMFLSKRVRESVHAK